MNLLHIPFVKHIGLERDNDDKLALEFREQNLNHLKTIHASAQFALAETASGDCLLNMFPDMADAVVPVLRDSQIKFKKPAQKQITAYPSIDDADAQKFREQLEKKGRAIIRVNVDIKDSDGVVAATGEFNWFVTKV